MANQEFAVTLSVEPEELARLNRIMAFKQSDYIKGKDPEDYEELLRLGSKDAAVREFLESIHEDVDALFDKEIPFPNGSYAEIMVFAPISIEDSAGAAVILYAVEHNEFNHITDSCLDRCCTSPKTPARYQLNHITDSRLDRLWKMDDRYGNTYIIDVREQEREIDKSPAGKRLREARTSLLKALDVPRNLSLSSSENLFIRDRATAYEALTQALPKALDAIEAEMNHLYLPQEKAREEAGNYLYTGHLEWKPVGEKAQAEASHLFPALRTFTGKCKTAQDTLFAKGKEAAPADSIPLDVMMYLDAVRELEEAAPKFSDTHTYAHLTFPSVEQTVAYQKAFRELETLRGRRDRNHDESLAEKTMREVYSEHKDSVDYNKLNQEAVERLIGKGAGSRTIRKAAEIARKINPGIPDARVYAKQLTKKANRQKPSGRN